MVLNSFMSSNHLLKLRHLLNVNIHHRNASCLGWLLVHFSLCEPVVQASLTERDLRIRLPSLWAGGGVGTHEWNHTLVIWRHCNAVVIVTMDWSERQQGFWQKVTTENGLGRCTMAYTTAVLPGGLRQKDRRELDYQFLYVKIPLLSTWQLCAGRSINVVQSTGVTVMGKAAKMRWGCLL